MNNEILNFSFQIVDDKISLLKLINKMVSSQFHQFWGNHPIAFNSNKNGKIDVVLGFDSVAEYIKAYEIGASPYFNSIIGRFAGRIKMLSLNSAGKPFN